MTQASRFESLQLRRHNQPSTPMRFRSSIPSCGPSTNAAVASASASIAPEATTVALATAGLPRQYAGQNVMRTSAGGPAFVIAGRAHRLVRDAKRSDQLVLTSRMANPDGPRRALFVRSSQIQVAAGIDGEIPERLEFARSHIHCQAFRHGAKVERQGSAQSDGPSIRIEADVPVADIVIGCARRVDDRSGAMFAVESARLHTVADCGVERAAGHLRHRQCELHGFVEDRARRRRRAGLRR